MTDDELQAIEAWTHSPKWPALPATLRDTADVLSRFVNKKGDQNVIDQLQAAADEVEALRAGSTALAAEVRRLQHVADFHIGAHDIAERKREAYRRALTDASNTLSREEWTRIAAAHGIEFAENTTTMT